MVFSVLAVFLLFFYKVCALLTGWLNKWNSKCQKQVLENDAGASASRQKRTFIKLKKLDFELPHAISFLASLFGSI